MTEESAERSHDPTPRRLEDARRKGEVPIGRDLLAATAIGGLLAAMLAMPEAFGELGRIGAGLIGSVDRVAAAPRGGPILPPSLAKDTARAILPWFVLPAAIVLATLVAQRGLVFAPVRLEPKLSRISILSGLRNRFGLSGLVEFAKSAVKLFAVSGLLSWYLWARLEEVLQSATLPPGSAMALMARLLTEFLILILAVQTVIGGIDLAWQRFDHLRRNRMTRRELLDEHKDSEGDPHQKAMRQARAREIAQSLSLKDMANATVVIVNPTHYAVALAWDPGKRSAPVCVAKGVDAMAARIREAAQLGGIPLRHDPPTARALHATVDIGAEIPPEHYKAVAAAIRFADAMRRKAGQRHPTHRQAR